MVAFMSSRWLLPEGLVVESMRWEADSITVAARSAVGDAVCPSCGGRSRRVHSRYLRTLSDLPCSGRVLRISVMVRPEPRLDADQQASAAQTREQARIIFGEQAELKLGRDYDGDGSREHPFRIRRHVRSSAGIIDLAAKLGGDLSWRRYDSGSHGRLCVIYGSAGGDLWFELTTPAMKV